ncbi:MAG: squalene synthase HpnC [Acidobacteria bacterium]|nr:squalene synthase HpnC [Acidobacteriota bacterium]
MNITVPARTPDWLDPAFFGGPAGEEEAAAFCRRLAASHYENFTAVSRLLPRPLRQHFANIYAYCRIADDLADETGNPGEALRRLDLWQEQLRACYAGNPSHPAFVALAGTVRTFDLPIEHFEHLLDAFRQDQAKTRYETWQELLGYCSRSANPVGRLVLLVCGYSGGRRAELSDRTCTALQLANFWQDVSRDFAGGRIYIPREILRKHGYDEESLGRKIVDERWTGLMHELTERTWPLFREGLDLIGLVEGRTRLAIELFSRGGAAILMRIRDLGYDTLNQRPSLSRWDKWKIAGSAVLRLPPRWRGAMPAASRSHAP